MTTAAKTSFKTLLQWGDGSTPDKFTTFAEITEIEPPNQEAGEIDATSHDSTAEEAILTFLNNGSITGTCNYLYTAAQTGAEAGLGSTAVSWQLCIPNFGARTKTVTVVEATDVFTATTHGLTTGQPIQISSSVTLPAGLTAGTTYYVRRIDADTFTLHTTNAGAVANSAQQLVSDTGTGTHTLQIGNRLDVEGLFKARQFTSPLKGGLQAKFTLKVTGPVVLT